MAVDSRYRSPLSEVSRAYQGAKHAYERAMARGDRDRADDALSRMRELERSVTVIVPPGLDVRR